MQKSKSFFVRGLNFLTLPAGATQTQTMLIQADSYFEIQKLTFASDLAAGVQTDSTRTIPQCTILITDTGSGEQLMNQTIDLTTIFGNGGNPFILPSPRFFAPNSAILVALTNYSASQSYNVRLSFIGTKHRVLPAGVVV